MKCRGSEIGRRVKEDRGLENERRLSRVEIQRLKGGLRSVIFRDGK